MTRIYDGNSLKKKKKKAGLKKHGEMRADVLVFFVGVVSRHVYPSFGLFSMVGAMEQCVNAT